MIVNRAGAGKTTYVCKETMAHLVPDQSVYGIPVPVIWFTRTGQALYYPNYDGPKSQALHKYGKVVVDAYWKKVIDACNTRAPEKYIALQNKATRVETI